MGKSAKAKNNAKNKMSKSEKKRGADTKKRRAKGHRQKGAGTVLKSRGTVVHGGIQMAEWQRSPKQLVHEMCAGLKRPRPQWRNVKGTPEGRFRFRVVLPDPKQKREKDLVFTPTQSYDSKAVAENMVSLLALYHVDKTRPHERRMPEPFKSAWLKLVGSGGGAKKPTRQKTDTAKKSTATSALVTTGVSDFGVGLHGGATSSVTSAVSTRRIVKKVRQVVQEVDDEGRIKKPCFTFVEHGECRFGDACRFSHLTKMCAVETVPVASNATSSNSYSVTATAYFASRADRDRARIETQHKRAHRRLELERKRKRFNIPRLSMGNRRRRLIEDIVRSVRAAWNAQVDRGMDTESDAGEIGDDDADMVKRLKSMGFPQARCEEAIVEVRKMRRRALHLKGIATSSSEVATDRKTDVGVSDTSEVLDWLMVHCNEDELPTRFNPKFQTIRVVSTKNGEDATPSKDPSVNALIRFGYTKEACESILQRSNIMGDQSRAAFALYENTYANIGGSVDVDDVDASLDDEVYALEAIFGEDFSVVVSADDIDSRAQKRKKQYGRAEEWLQVTFKSLDGVKQGTTELVIFRRSGSKTCNTVVSRKRCQNGRQKGGGEGDEDDTVSTDKMKRDTVASGKLSTPRATATAATKHLDESFFGSDEGDTFGSRIGLRSGSVPSKHKRKSKESHDSRRRRRRRPGNTKSKKEIAAISSALLGSARNAATKHGREFAKMQKVRADLPMSRFKTTVIDTIEGSQVSLISGETGCGKTTQVPQFLLEHYVNNNRGGECSIVCTQPRRLAAIGVAERVADERFEKCGDVVGYSIRGDRKSSSRTRLMFCTTGILLRRMRCSGIDDITHVLVDEVHERGVDTDFLLCLLRDLVRSRPSLRVVLMSATLDADRFVTYFGGPKRCPAVKVPGRTFPVKQFYLADVWKLTGTVPKGKSSGRTGRNVTKSEVETREMLALEKKYGSDIASALSKYTTRSLLADGIDYANIVGLVRCICEKSLDERNFPPGAILIFMPGTAEISRLVSMLRRAMGSSVLALALHGSLSGKDQRKVFKHAPAGVRKVVVSTNIAETSITIDDVVYVIDSGRVKEMQYDAFNKMPKLSETWVSRASADQRKGRAGRVRNGFCYRMYPLRSFDRDFSAYQTPEIRRVPLESLCLQVKVLEIGKVREFLGRAIDPPDPAAISAAMGLLYEVGALEKPESGGGPSRLTSLGRHLSSLPVDVRVGKTLIFGSVLRCLEPVLTIAALMSSRSPFLSPPDKREEAREAQASFVSRRSDHLTLLNAYHAWEDAPRKRAFASDHFLRHESLEAASSLRNQFARDIDHLRMLPKGCSPRDALDLTSTANANALKLPLIRAALCAGLHGNVVKAVNPAQKYDEVHGGAVAVDPKAKEIRYYCRGAENEGHVPKERVFMHPASVNFQERSYPMRYLVFHQKVQTSRVYLRDSTAVPPYALLLFCGHLHVEHSSLADRRRATSDDAYSELSVDQWIRFEAPSRVGALVRELRALLAELLRRKIERPTIDVSKSPLIEAFVELLMNSGL
eukprot:g2717.t1